MFTLSEALKILDQLTEPTLRQLRGDEARLVKAWLPARFEESLILYPDDNDPEEIRTLADRLRGFDDPAAANLVEKVRRFWSNGPAQIDYDTLRDAAIVK